MAEPQKTADPRDAKIAELEAKLAATVGGGPAPEAPEPQLFKVSIAANVASDANGRAYNTYCIPDPKKYWQRRVELHGLKYTPREQIGASETVLAPQAQRHNVIVLERGGEPIEIIISKEQLDQLKSDKKNLNIFRVEEVKGPARLGPIKTAAKPIEEDEEDEDPKHKR